MAEAAAASAAAARRRIFIDRRPAVIYKDAGATLHDLREAVNTFEDAERIARRVLGGTHPLLVNIEGHLRLAREKLRARESLHT